MTKGHKIYIGTLTILVVLTIIALTWIGFSYYDSPLEERFYHADYLLLSPGRPWGHGFGVAGALCMIFGIILYSLRKRIRSFGRFGNLKYWLEFHIFLCTLGPVLVLYHTSFKFGGIVAVSFWSMVAVFLSGIIGRFIYIQIPRTIEGRELSLSEIRDMKSNLGSVLAGSYNLDEESYNLIVDSTRKKVELYEKNLLLRLLKRMREDRKAIHKIRHVLKSNLLTHSESRKIIKLAKNEISMNRRIDWLVTMQTIFKYWHVAHFPFAIVMLIIMAIHVAVTIVLGYRWIF